MQTARDYNFWCGEKVRLRAWSIADAEMAFAEQWDSESIRVLEAGIQPPDSLEAFQEWIVKTIREPNPQSLRFVVEALDGEMVGWANLRGWQNNAGTFTFAIRIYRAYRHRGYAVDAVRILLRYGFYELRCQKANSATIANNDPSIRLHHKLGFVEEGRLRRNCFTDGQYLDEVLFGLTREEFDAWNQKV